MATNPQSPSSDLGDAEAAELADKAARCRRLAAGISDRQASDVLRSMAENYDRTAAKLNEQPD